MCRAFQHFQVYSNNWTLTAHTVSSGATLIKLARHTQRSRCRGAKASTGGMRMEAPQAPTGCGLGRGIPSPAIYRVWGGALLFRAFWSIHLLRFFLPKHSTAPQSTVVQQRPRCPYRWCHPHIQWTWTVCLVIHVWFASNINLFRSTDWH